MSQNAPDLTRRIGFYYFPDSLHYRQEDLETWLPVLRDLGAAWVVLPAPTGRAIPEPFLAGLLSAGIQPVLHFNHAGGHAVRLGEETTSATEMGLLLKSYARWDVHYAVFYDRPNLRQSWTPQAWAQGSLVEHFLDAALPLMSAAAEAGITPVLPPLEPGGDYWDLAFLRSMLRSLVRRAPIRVLDALALSAQAFTRERPLSWGAGGPERWPGLLPYHTPAGSEDHLGFRIFDWYLSIAEQELERRPEIFLLRMGAQLAPDGDAAGVGQVNGLRHARGNLDIARLLCGDLEPGLAGASPVTPPNVEVGRTGISPVTPPSVEVGRTGISPVTPPAVEVGPAVQGVPQPKSAPAQPAPPPAQIEPVPSEVLAGCFWLLASEPGPGSEQAWHHPERQPLPVVGALRQYMEFRRKRPAPVPLQDTRQPARDASGPALAQNPASDSPAGGNGKPAAREAQAADTAADRLLRMLQDALAVDPCSLASPASGTPGSQVSSPGGVAAAASPETLPASAAAGSPETLPAYAAAMPPETVAAPAAAEPSSSPNITPKTAPQAAPAPARRPIAHYVLLPLYAWGAANWDLALLEPLLQDSHPTIGFSLAEARLARRVTVIGGEGAISLEALSMLRESGCQVERILDDGTILAS